MRLTLLSKATAALGFGVGLGFLASLIVLQNRFGFNRLQAGPWLAWSHAGDELDPYAQAKLAYFHEIPLGAAEGLKFVALTTSQGGPLDGHCDYRVSGPLPRTRYWTLVVYSPEGENFADDHDKSGLTSADILRQSDGGFEIVISQNARPGNWLPLANARDFSLALTLYDLEASGADSHLFAAGMPSIVRDHCS
jgi:hypothetical protein